MNDLFPFAHKELIGFASHLQCSRALKLFFFSVYLGFDRHIVLGKKLLRLNTGLSARTVVAPVDFCHDWTFQIAFGIVGWICEIQLALSDPRLYLKNVFL